jgi:hypothetical protein
MTSPDEYIHTAVADVGQAIALQRFRARCPTLRHLTAMAKR